MGVSSGKRAPDLAGRAFIDLGENRIETPETAEAGLERNLDHRQIGLAQ
jgi:hypothetical protein